MNGSGYLDFHTVYKNKRKTRAPSEDLEQRPVQRPALLELWGHHVGRRRVDAKMINPRGAPSNNSSYGGNAHYTSYRRRILTKHCRFTKRPDDDFKNYYRTPRIWPCSKRTISRCLSNTRFSTCFGPVSRLRASKPQF